MKTCLPRQCCVVALLFFLQGCTTAKIDVVLPSINPGHGWSVDASNWLIYKESFWGPRLAMHVSASTKTSESILIQISVNSNFSAPLSFDLQKIKLKVNNNTYVPSATTCGLSPSTIDGDRVMVNDLPLNVIYRCLRMRFDAPLVDWTSISLHLDGLFKGSENLIVPEIKFHKTKQARPGSFVG